MSTDEPAGSRDEFCLPPDIEEMTLLKRYPQPLEPVDLLADSGDREHQVQILGNQCDFDTYCHGFLRAANLTVDGIVQPRIQSVWSDHSAFGESPAYAALYLYRHWLELRLKELILACGCCPPTHHFLARLWSRFQSLDHGGCSNAGTVEGLTADRVADTIIAQIDRIDHNAEIFRYPTDKKGKKIAVPALCIDLVQLKQLMGWLDTYLRGWSTCLYEMRQAKWESALNAEHEH